MMALLLMSAATLRCDVNGSGIERRLKIQVGAWTKGSPVKIASVWLSPKMLNEDGSVARPPKAIEQFDLKDTPPPSSKEITLRGASSFETTTRIVRESGRQWKYFEWTRGIHVPVRQETGECVLSGTAPPKNSDN